MKLYLETECYSVYIAEKGEWSDSRAALHEAACLYMRGHGLPCTELTVTAGQHGKPYFAEDGAPRFSVSHSGGIWMAAFSPQEIGLDIQQERPCPKEAISKRFFHPDEDAYLAAGGYEDFFTVWAAKEARAKYAGTGIGPDFSKICCVRNGVFGTETETIDVLPAPEGFRICVCRSAGKI